jgi:hypothetical protein
MVDSARPPAAAVANFEFGSQDDRRGTTDVGMEEPVEKQLRRLAADFEGVQLDGCQRDVHGPADLMVVVTDDAGVPARDEPSVGHGPVCAQGQKIREAEGRVGWVRPVEQAAHLPSARSLEISGIREDRQILGDIDAGQVVGAQIPMYLYF